MKILGIDPGTGRLGWSILEILPRSKPLLLDCGCIETPVKTTLPKRLKIIYDFLTELVRSSKPDQFAIESLFFSNNAKTAIDVGAARGVAILCAEQHNLPIFEYTPLQVKSSLTGFGKADKKQVEFMVMNILKIKTKIKPDDAVDAVAIALTHSFHKKH
ncbi:crossover junction endodeoxyribonuclease RuvC [Candidatus Collierbacteria bacterium RIFOXYD1_FULL_40_9]|uniref:Crossover junction endodeoxyribonuclease RuvC n=1 Tax=Candidatus Collierbacteria bacterium RIFOXYD1_FULL_40_9 TaxID=1817731 RepID=A0A1F5FPV4_9BACT|nr:MAG: crossover junction endodeoxyribonuclease RuvC [Candidatus Collierbacteria bacterium RIFOXYD1_FULL_40_9]